MDLHTFGFRPDLSRCSPEARHYKIDGKNVPYSRIESVAIDVTSMTNLKGMIGPLVEVGLSSLQLYHMAYFTDSHLTEYLLAWSGLNQNTNQLISETLKSIYHAQAWGNETVQICVMVSLYMLPSSHLLKAFLTKQYFMFLDLFPDPDGSCSIT